MTCKVAASHEAATINDGWMFRYATDSVAAPIHLPHSWNGDAYHTREYKRGVGEYTKQLYIPASAEGKRVYLKFDGAATKSEVAINGCVIDAHIGGYSSHVVDITPHVTTGSTHALTVTEDNSDTDIPP